MEFTNSYFEDEVRDGFYVPTMVKRAWAAEIEVLNEIDRICRKYDIKYFADWGTLLGAVRHGGFIPWDDDLDISMKRSDYKRFLEVAKKELSGDYKVFTFETHPDFWHFMARVVAKPTICFEKEHLKRFHEFPYIVGVDIFVLDYVAFDDEKEDRRCKIARYVIEVADEICTKDVSKNDINEYFRVIENACDVKIPYDLKTMRDKHKLRVYLYKLAETLFDAFSEEESVYLTRMMPNGLYNKGLRLSKEYYDEMLRLPFENITIPVPTAYDEMLRKRYGDYMKILKDVGGHDYPFFEIQQKQLDKVLAKEPKISLPQYAFSKEKLVRDDSFKQNSVKVMAKECQQELEQLFVKLTDFVEECKYENALEILEESQQLAIDFGTIVEKCKGEGYITVDLLQEYCENIFVAYELILKLEDKGREPLFKSIEDIRVNLQKIGESVEKDIISRKEVVIITYKASQWNYIKYVWKAAIEDDESDVYVIVVPYYYKDFDGSVRDMQYEADNYPNNVKITKYDEFDFGLHYPDIIFIQNAYDNVNKTLTVHNFFYSDNLMKYTDKLIYIPPFEVEEFAKENYREYLNMKHYCTIPGVVNSDITFVQSDNMRELYIEKLTEFAGEDTRQIWEKKIVSRYTDKEEDDVYRYLHSYSNKNSNSNCIENGEIDLPGEWKKKIYKKDGSRKKIILYYIGVSNFIQYKEEMLKKMKEVLRIFWDNREEVALILQDNKLINYTLKENNLDLYNKYMEIIGDFCNKDWAIFNDKEDEQILSICDAYYGDTSPIVQKFRNAKKPVMIQNVTII